MYLFSQKGGDDYMTARQKLREHIKEVADWRKAGMTKKEIAARLGMTANTMYRAAKADTQIAKVLLGQKDTTQTETMQIQTEEQAQIEKDTMQNTDTEAIKAIKNQSETTSCVCLGLRKRCTGYRAVVTKHYKVKRPLLDDAGMPVLDGAKKQVMTEELEQVEEVQDIPPDLDAIKFFLMNQDKETWKIDPERIRQESKKTETHTNSYEGWLQEIEEREEMEETEEMEHEE